MNSPLREARAALVLRFFDSQGDILLSRSTYQRLSRHYGLSRRQVDIALDDLAIDGLVTLEARATGVMIRPLKGGSTS